MTACNEKRHPTDKVTKLFEIKINLFEKSQLKFSNCKVNRKQETDVFFVNITFTHIVFAFMPRNQKKNIKTHTNT